MEDLLHYCWKHKLGALSVLHTVDGEPVEILNPGMHNHHAGPDFIGAKLRIGQTVWAGNVEIHVRASDWYRHRHDTDEAYAQIVLHVVAVSDMRIPRPGHPDEYIPQMVWEVPSYVSAHYDELSRAEVFPRCSRVVSSLPSLRVNSWLSALAVERLQKRTDRIMDLLKGCDCNWEDTFFATLSRHFGFGVNGDAFEEWARHIPLSAVGKHRDNLMQVEAVFFGQAGMLDTDPSAADGCGRHAFAGDEERRYFETLRREYLYLKHKFSLEPMDASMWRFLRVRPQNFPTVRIAQLAMLYHEHRCSLSRLLDAASVESMYDILNVHVSEFWTRHYLFTSSPSPAPSCRHLSKSSVNLLIINAVAPFFFAYGRYRGDEALSDRAFSLLENLPAETNHYIRSWADAGVVCRSALDGQALLQLSKCYCMPHDCLRCRFGYDYIRATPDFLREDSAADATVES